MQNIICLLQNEVLYSSLRQTLDQEQAMGAVAEREVTASQDRGALAKMVMTLLDHWRLSTEDQAALLGIATSNRAALSNYRSGKPIGTSRDQYERVGHLLGIHKNLRLLFPQNRDLAYRWMTTRNKAFDNLTPVEVVKEWGFAGLLMVRGYLDRARGV
uniref:MbcA/ParS/Xre antitoxin family protein n=2 Tax=Ferrovum sp. JA12 TaxID=1356299 RepID=UPI001955782D|nr:MbcA/ParS/Xre antitoxin family protein [Ferrovum sp. JA12]